MLMFPACLHWLVAMATTGFLFCHFSFKQLNLLKATKNYRTAHSRLTYFILIFNDSTVSQIISYYLHYIVPLQAFSNVSIYFGRHKMSLFDLFSECLFVSVFWLLLGMITYFTVAVNSKIASSGATVGAILARRKGIQRHNSHTWSHELFKLSTYYELVWRTEKELAFTTGLNNSTMNWQYILEVSILYSVLILLNYFLNLIFIYLLQFAIFYSSFVLYFASKFINSEDGFKA